MPLFVRRRIESLHAQQLHRDPPLLRTEDGARGHVDGRPALLFCSNDYLGLRLDPRLARAASRAAERWGTGSGSSRLIAGSLSVHAALEAELADWMGAERALVFSSGYQANLALLSGLAQRGDLVVSDALNHASLIDGCRLSRAGVERVAHADADAAREALSLPSAGERFLVGEGLYSMDGDRGPVAAWASVATDAGAWLLVDEAHAVGVLGPEGAGTCAEAELSPHTTANGSPLLARVGTFGKALGSHGAFVAADSETCDLLANVGRSYVFTTALPPPSAEAARVALGIVRSDEGAELRARVLALSGRLARGARDLGLDLAGFHVERPTPIVPVVLGSPERALAVSNAMLELGVYARAIRPPTVPEGTSRIRFTLSAVHTEEDVDVALRALERALS